MEIREIAERILRDTKRSTHQEIPPSPSLPLTLFMDKEILLFGEEYPRLSPSLRGGGVWPIPKELKVICVQS